MTSDWVGPDATWTALASVQPTPAASEQTRRALTPHLQALGLSADAQHGLTVAVSEAVDNVVLHSGLGPDDQITVRYRRVADTIEVAVATPRVDWTLPTPKHMPADDRHPTRYGLALIRALTDGVTLVHTERETALILSKHIA